MCATGAERRRRRKSFVEHDGRAWAGRNEVPFGLITDPAAVSKATYTVFLWFCSNARAVQRRASHHERVAQAVARVIRLGGR